MRDYIQILIFVTIGVALLWFGYSLFFAGRKGSHTKPRRHKEKGTRTPGEPQVCPICSTHMEKGDLVKTLAYPSVTGGRDRLMHVRGCFRCLSGETHRNCPVCGATLGYNDFLIARLFERRFRKPHVHVLGCAQCRRLGNLI